MGKWLSDHLYSPDAFHTRIGVQDKATFQLFLIATIMAFSHFP